MTDIEQKALALVERREAAQEASRMDNPQAFPHLEPRDPSFSYCDNGMTLLDYFAGQALVGLLHNFTANGWHNPNAYQIKCVTDAAYITARAMLTARKEANDEPA